MENKPFIKQKAWEGVVGVSPIDKLVIMWHIPTVLSSALSQTQSQRVVTKSGNIPDC